jgi:hypothetical protein
MIDRRLLFGAACVVFASAILAPIALTSLRPHLGGSRADPMVTPEAPTPPDGAYQSSLRRDQRRAFFGELHLHTTMSFDAWSFGGLVTPDQAYKFGRGETVMVPAAQIARQQGIQSDGPVPARRSWPLDFMAVTDHSEYMGVVNQFADPANPMSKTPLAEKFARDPHSAVVMIGGLRGGATPPPELNAGPAMTDAWNQQVKAANDNYRPGKFTTFIAYEWTSAPDGRNLHRNVIFNADHAPMPFTSAQSRRPEDLWTYLETIRAKGIDVIAIPHNGNASDGLMYDWNDSDGRPISEAYAQRRLKNEPLTEIAQNKGVSDTTPTLSPNDEFANFEIFDRLISRPSIKSKPDGSYIRQALGRGLVLNDRVGANPYKYGLVGATDIHNGLSTTDEAGVGGAFGVAPRTMTPKGDMAKSILEIVKSPARLDSDADAKGAQHIDAHPLEVGTGGVTGVWAEANTRNAIYAALKRKETFATSGTRIRVRMFAGWAYPAAMTQRPDWVSVAYSQGVAMGGDLPARPATGRGPTLILQATKDPDGANLDRIQVIKMWRSGDGFQEKIFNVALSGGRRADPKTGKAPPVGDTVDLKTGKSANTIGAAALTAQWTDPEFDPSSAAVYYARVLEIPTARWSTRLAIANKLPIPTSRPATIQERAWTSPIWYTPRRPARG